MQAIGYTVDQTSSATGELRDSGEPSKMLPEGSDPYYLAVDPGLHSGWAVWDIKGDVITMGTTNTYDELHDLLAHFPSYIKVVIIEDFILFKQKAREQTGSRMPAPKAIGQIETFARLWGAEIVKQPSSIKSTAEKWTGKSTKGMAHSKTHMWDAYNHGEYHLIYNRIKPLKV